MLNWHVKGLRTISLRRNGLYASHLATGRGQGHNTPSPAAQMPRRILAIALHHIVAWPIHLLHSLDVSPAYSNICTISRRLPSASRAKKSLALPSGVVTGPPKTSQPACCRCAKTRDIGQREGDMLNALVAEFISLGR